MHGEREEVVRRKEKNVYIGRAEGATRNKRKRTMKKIS
jgi:hypothetical protein